ncbi:MAG: hypothetical protein MUP17_09970 [candidate division Zixibacteria bacterium]|nr:hypothetical protein [candidate division Zixibacteria bacterium]
MMEICEFCGRETEGTQGTSMTGAYCIGCLRLTIKECQNAIKELQERKHNQGKDLKRKISTEGNSVDKAYNDAFKNLIEGPKDI